MMGDAFEAPALPGLDPQQATHRWCLSGDADRQAPACCSAHTRPSLQSNTKKGDSTETVLST